LGISWELVGKVAGPLSLVLATELIRRLFADRPRLVVYIGHLSAHQVRPPDGKPFGVNTHAIVVVNTGRRAAMNVRLSHLTLPDFTVFPDVNNQVVELPGGGREILFPVLVPKEQVTVSYLYSPPLTAVDINTGVRSDEGMARVLDVIPTEQLPRWKIRTLGFLVLVGVVGTVYFLFEGLVWIVNRIQLQSG
jgi:hypothetical protein